VVSRITVLGVKGIPIVKPGDDLVELICRAAKKQSITINDHDIIVVAQTVVSKAEGMIFRLAEIKPSLKAKHIAERV
jgi:coenzyme F420-0:L-glutamate ligase/coenzyme F420-1:gamma-L-glutamate ligase